MATATFKISASAEEVVKETRKATDAITEQAKELAKVAEHERMLDRLQRQVRRDSTTAQEKYNQRIRDLQTLLQNARIDQDTFNRSAAQARERLTEATLAQDRFASSSAMGRIEALGAGFLTFAGVVATARDALRFFNEEKERALEGKKEDAAGLGQLAQVAVSGVGGREDVAQMRQEARKLFAEGASETLGEAALLRFSIRSAGVDDAMDLISRMKQSRLVNDVGSLIEGAAALRQAMTEAETGDLTAIVSKGFGVSGYTPATVEALLAGAATPGAAASALGLRDEEVLAAVSLVSAITKDARTAGTQVDALLKGIEKKGQVTGDSLVDIMEQVADKVARGTDLRELVGEDLAVAGYRNLRNNFGKFVQAIADADAGQASKSAIERMELALADPSVATELARQRQQNQAKLSLEDLGNRVAIEQALYENVSTFERQIGTPGIVRYLSAAVRSLGRSLPTPPLPSEQAFEQSLAELETRAQYYSGTGNEEAAATLRERQEHLRVLREIAKNTKKDPPPPVVPRPESN